MIKVADENLEKGISHSHSNVGKSGKGFSRKTTRNKNKKVFQFFHFFMCGFRGGRPFPQGFDPLPIQRVPILNCFEIFVLVMDPKIVLKAPLACFFKILPNQVFFSALGELGKSIWST